MPGNKLALNCFSPPVMLATFIFEIISAIYILFRYKRSMTAGLIVSILVCLAIFQLTEYMLCGGFGLSGNLWSKIGYLAITMLPPLGLHLAYSIAKKKSRRLVPLAYLSAAIFLIYFAFYTEVISGQTCYANYVVFESRHDLLPPILYAVYYYGWLLVGALVCLRLESQLKNKHLSAALIALAIGYASFILPTTVVNLVNPATIAGIPSIMCGFAVILAAILVAKVAPDSCQVDARTLSSRR